jgi:uncharacterized ferritin-like protein (DUF455 family)
MELKQLLQEIVAQPALHAKWLNALSMMENVGARKIAASEHPIHVDELMLKHAAEEARHAYYLKKQLKKLVESGYETYAQEGMMAPIASYHYLHRLDVMVSRYLQTALSLKGQNLRYAAYLLVTYAIEIRADGLYPVYQEVLQETGSRVSVRTIIAEEKGHLEEMTAQLTAYFGDWQLHAKRVESIEQTLFDTWMLGVMNTVIEVQSETPSID